ncbi:MAG: putative protease [bacterium]|jgi:putative protease
MQCNISIRNQKNLAIVKDLPFDEVLIYPAIFSKVGEIKLSEIQSIVQILKDAGKKIIFVWDKICRDLELERLLNLFKNLPIEDFYAIRFLDIGVGNYLKENYPDLPLQITVERNSHNQSSILGWVDYFQPQLQRVVLANEIPINEIKKFRNQISCEVELLGLGQIEVFYTPRSLVQHHQKEQSNSIIKLKVASEDRPDRWSPVIENEHGTFMFNDRDLFILDNEQELKEAQIDMARIEPYTDQQYELLQECTKTEEWVKLLKEQWPQKTTRGFFRANKTNAPFVRLTNKFLQGKRGREVGRVIEYVKMSHLVINIQKPISIPQTLIFHSPEGRTTGYSFTVIKTLAGQEITGTIKPGNYILPWVKHAVSRSIIQSLDSEKEE